MAYEDHFSDGKVECKECGNRYTFITSNHLKKHGLTTQEYKNKYPEAEIAGKAFSTKQKYKNKKMFEEKDEDETTNTINDIVIEDFPLPDDEEDDLNNELDHFESYDNNDLIIDDDYFKELKSKAEETNKFSNIKLNHKLEVAKYLNILYPNIIHDYFIEIKNHQDHLLHKLVTDFSDPKNKIAFFFPDVYWHNEESPSIINKYQILKDYNWKIIEVKGIDVVYELKNMLKK